MKAVLSKCVHKSFSCCTLIRLLFFHLLSQLAGQSEPQTVFVTEGYLKIARYDMDFSTIFYSKEITASDKRGSSAKSWLPFCE